MHTVTIREGVISQMTGECGCAETERGIAAQHCAVGADFLVAHADGSYSLTFPSVADYTAFLIAVADSSAPADARADILRRHRDAS